MSLASCVTPVDYVANGDDCDDNDGSVFPGAAEVCNGRSDDCDGEIDEGFQVVSLFTDGDHDGWGGASILTCLNRPGVVATGGDCDDGDETVHPGAAETCNGIDDNCAEGVDEGVLTIYYLDADVDGYGDPAAPITACTRPDGYVTHATDCDDTRFTVHPGATETCNGVDDNCVDGADEGLLLSFFRDSDGDTYGDANVSLPACSAPTGYVPDATDCDDALAAVHPDATETCNGIDDNCVGGTDEGVMTTYYRDADVDGYGDAAVTAQACSVPAGYVTNSTDCDDTRNTVRPGGTEVCNGLDDNCLNGIDEGVKTTFYRDADADTYGSASVTTAACSVPAGYVTNATDCNDGADTIHPGAMEACNGVDDNCDTIIDGPTATPGPYTAGTGNWNVVTGGGWEAGVTGWTDVNPTLGLMRTSTARAFAGSRSLLTSTAQADSGAGYGIRRAVVVVPGVTYVLSGFLHTAGLAAGNLYLDLGDVAGDQNAGVTAGGSQWQFVSREWTAPAGVTSVYVRVVRDGVRVTNEAGYVDEVALTARANFTPPTRPCGPVSY